MCIRHDGNWKKSCVGWRWEGQRLLADSVLFVDECVGVCGAEGGLSGHNQASKVALAAKY